MSETLVGRDERTTTVENAGYRWSYLILSFGLLAIVAFRSFTVGETSWDLLSLVLLGGIVNVGYQGFRRVVNRRRIALVFVTIILALLLAALMAIPRH